MRVDHSGIPCAAGTCSYAALNAKLEAGDEVSQPRIYEARKMVCHSALEARIWQPIIRQVTDAVHRVLEEGGGGEDDHPDRWIDEGDDVEGGNEPGEFPDVDELFECLHGDGSGCRIVAGERV